MDIKSWKAMFERRGYQGVQVEQEGTSIRYLIPGIVQGIRPAFQFSRLTYKGARREMNQEFGWGMEHVVHGCGCPLLKAPSGYTCDEPLSPIYVSEPLRHVQFYEVPLQRGSKPVDACPQCGELLSTKVVHRVKDPESL